MNGIYSKTLNAKCKWLICQGKKKCISLFVKGATHRASVNEQGGVTLSVGLGLSLLSLYCHSEYTVFSLYLLQNYIWVGQGSM